MPFARAILDPMVLLVSSDRGTRVIKDDLSPLLVSTVKISRNEGQPNDQKVEVGVDSGKFLKD